MFTLRFENSQNKKMASSQVNYDVITALCDTFYTIKYWNLIYTANTLQIFPNLLCRNSNIKIHKGIKLKHYA